MIIKIPAVTLNTAHSVGRSGITICMGIQNGGFALELQKQNMNRKIILIGINFHKKDKREREKGPWKITNAKIKNPPITIIENGCMQFRNRSMKAWLFRN